MDGEDQDRVGANYRQNYDRLVEVKRRYDPDNLFHLNQNITLPGRDLRLCLRFWTATRAGRDWLIRSYRRLALRRWAIERASRWTH